MKKIIKFLLIFVHSMNVQSQSIDSVLFQSLTFNIRSIEVHSIQNQTTVVGKQTSVNGDTLIVAQISANKDLKWQKNYYSQGKSLYVQDIIQNNEVVIVLVKTITTYNAKIGKREENDGLILCYDRVGNLLWHKEKPYIPISAAFKDEGSFIFSYLTNPYNGLIQRLNLLGLEVLDYKVGNEIRDVVLDDAIPYSEGVLLRYGQGCTRLWLAAAGRRRGRHREARRLG